MLSKLYENYKTDNIQEAVSLYNSYKKMFINNPEKRLGQIKEKGKCAIPLKKLKEEFERYLKLKTEYDETLKKRTNK